MLPSNFAFQLGCSAAPDVPGPDPKVTRGSQCVQSLSGLKLSQHIALADSALNLAKESVRTLRASPCWCARFRSSLDVTTGEGMDIHHLAFPALPQKYARNAMKHP